MPFRNPTGRQICDNAPMNGHAAPTSERIVCRRLLRPQRLSEHRRCPYCFGAPDDIRSADHQRFCDFQPGVDPLAFGFPPGVGRLARR